VDRSRHLAAIVGLVAVLLVGAVGTGIAAMGERTRERQRDQQLATVALGAMSDNLAGVATSVSGVDGLAADGVVSGAEFDAFAEKVVEASALTTLANVVIVADRDRAEFEARSGRRITERDAQGRFVPAGRRDRHAVVVDVVPLSAANTVLLGFDILSDPARAAAAGAASRTKAFVLSSEVPLAPSGRPGFFVIQPVFGPGSDQPIGFVSTGILKDLLVEAARARLPAGTEVGVAYGAAQAPPGVAAVSRDIAGGRWTVWADDRKPADLTAAITIAVATVLLIVLLGFLSWREIRHDRVRQALASRLSEEGKRAERLAEVGRRLSLASDLDTVVRVVEQDVCALFEADLGDVGLLTGGDTLGMLAAKAPLRFGPLEHLPVAEAVRRRGIVVAEDPAEYGATDSEAGSVAAVPLFNRDGDVFGVIVLGWRERQSFAPTVAPLLRTVGEMFGQILDRLREAERRHAFLTALQQRLLPMPPAIGGLEIVARYRPAAAAMGMGGDWYQFLALPDGSMVIVVGDVIGHGVDAIAVMMQIQHVTATVVQMGVPLADVFSRVDTAMGPAAGAHASATLLHLDTAANQVRYISAGHPYSLLCRPDGTVEQLSGAQNAMVGLPWKSPATAQIDFPPGSILLAYTDGLVERRNRPLTEGIGVLASVLTAAHGSDLDSLADLLIERAMADAGDERVDDDLAMVLIRSIPTPPMA
jgi:uncharacterized protein YigA (DUF484 family)